MNIKYFGIVVAATVLSGACSPPFVYKAECKKTTKAEVARLFDRWNNSLQTGDSKQVVANYAPESILLPILSNKVRGTAAEKEDYFRHFFRRRTGRHDRLPPYPIGM